MKIIITGAPSGGPSGPSASGPSGGTFFSRSGSGSGFFSESTGALLLPAQSAAQFPEAHQEEDLSQDLLQVAES